MKLLSVIIVMTVLSCSKPQKCPEPVIVNEIEVLGKYLEDWVCFEAEGHCYKAMKKNLEKQ